MTNSNNRLPPPWHHSEKHGTERWRFQRSLHDCMWMQNSDVLRSPPSLGHRTVCCGLGSMRSPSWLTAPQVCIISPVHTS